MAGGQAKLARGIRERVPGSKVGQVHVWGWLNSVKFEVPPPEVVIAISEFLDYRMTPHELRPDLYPNPTDALPDELRAAHSSPAVKPREPESFGGFGDPRGGANRRENGDRRVKTDPSFGEFGECRDGDRRVEDRRKDATGQGGTN